MTPGPTPEQLIANAEALAPMLAAEAEAIDQARRLPPHIVDALRKAGLFRMPAPRAWGGCEADPMTQNRVIETIAAASGSAGWCVMIAAANGYFSAFLDDETGRSLFPDVDGVVAGAFVPPARADRVPGGYRVSGRLPFASGITHSTHVAAGAALFDGGEPVKRPNGAPLTRTMVIPVEQVEILDTWYTGGMRGSGSNDFAIHDVFVREEHTFSIDEPKREGPLWKLPWMFLTNHPGTPLGLGRGALNEFARVIRAKPATFGAPPREQAHVQIAFANATATVAAARGFVYDSLGELWASLVAGRDPSVEERTRMRLAITFAHDACVKAVDELYHAAGSAAVYTPNALDRYFRDVHTADQHIMANAGVYQGAGKALLTGALPAAW